MLPKDTRLISVDDHIHEPPNLWLDRLPAKHQDAAPRVVELANGNEGWAFEGEVVPVDQACTLPHDGAPMFPRPARFDLMRPGCYEPNARILDMDTDGVWAQLAFPQYSRFVGHRFFPTNDAELSLLCVQAYNDFVLDEWSATDPERLLAMAIIPWWDLDASVKEVQRTTAAGAKAIAFSENPTVLGMPSVHTKHWDPLWQAISEADVPVCMHIGSSSRMVTSSDDAPVPVQWTATGTNSLLAFADWIWSGIFDRFPTLRAVLSEGGAGWVPYALERSGKFLPTHPAWEGTRRPPLEVFREHMFACMVTDEVAVDNVHRIGEDNLLWESDFPHTDSMWPDSRTILEQVLADVPDDIAVKIGSTNAQRVFRLNAPVMA